MATTINKFDKERGVEGISSMFKHLKDEGRAALIPFITAGDPDLDTSRDLVLALAEAGADLIELGVPFSDPLADGPTIQASSHRALDGGVTPELVLKLVADVRKAGCNVPIILMGYYNTVLQYGLVDYAEAMVDAGADGTIIADLPLEESGEWRRIAALHGLANIFLVAPTTPISRARFISEASTGFLYYVSVTGITGARTELPSNLIDALKGIKAVSPVPLAVGFGISTPEQVEMLSGVADGIIIGSAIVRVMESNMIKTDDGFVAGPELVSGVKGFVETLASAIRPAS